MGNKKHHIIFDLDGTLIDSKNEILKTYRLVFNEVPPATMPDLEKLNYGLTIFDLLKGIYVEDDDKIVKAKTLFSSVYDHSDFAETNLYEGVYETLSALKHEGYEMHIATNKRYVPTTRILEAKKIRHLFSQIFANEMTPGVTLTKQQMIAEIKRIGLFTDGFMVGDTVNDIQAGMDEGLKTIAVNYGYEHKDLLAARNPTHSIDRFENLYTFVLEQF